MTEQITIRPETKDDFNGIFELHHLAFGRTSEAQLVQALRMNSMVFVPELSIVAVDKSGKIVGHILFTKINIRSGERDMESLALAPMAVSPDHQRMGIGGQLIRTGLDLARNLGFQSVVVLGHENYYPKFGFRPAREWQIKAPFEVPAPAFMAIELVENGLRNASGTVVYPEEFDAV